MHGLVEKLSGTPAKIRATPVKEALSILVKHEKDRAQKRISTLKTETKMFLKHFAPAPKLEMEEKTSFALMKNRENIMSKTSTMMKKAEREFDIACSGRKLMQFIRSLADQFKIITEKGIRVRMISDLVKYEDLLQEVIKESVSLRNSIDLRYADLPSSHYMIVDFKEALVSTTTEGNMGENPCLWTNSENLVGVLQKDFENLWHNSART
jgi:sugar-specific transcriptional regulator TrmB